MLISAMTEVYGSIHAVTVYITLFTELNPSNIMPYIVNQESYIGDLTNHIHSGLGLMG